MAWKQQNKKVVQYKLDKLLIINKAVSKIKNFF